MRHLRGSAVAGAGVALGIAALAAAARPPVQGGEPRYVRVYAGRYDAFPSAVLLRNGDLLVAFRTGGGHIGPDGKIALARSKDGGSTWSTAVIFDNAGVDDRTDLGLTQLRDGTLVLPFFDLTWAPDGTNSARAFLITSRNNGRTWSPPRQITIPQSSWVAVYGRIVERRDGTLLEPAYIRRDGTLVSVLLESRSRGARWALRSTIAVDGGNETSVLALGRRRLLGFVRGGYPTAVATISQVISRDAGRSWSKPRLLFRDRVSPDVIRLRNGHLLLCVGDRSENPGVSCQVSKDGRSWSSGKLIFRATNKDIGYPSSVQLSGGKILTAYYSDAWHIDAAIFSERFLLRR